MVSDEILGADVVIKFRVPNLCTQEDLEDTGMTLEEMVRWIIDEGGLFGVADDEFEYVSITQA